MPPFLRRHAWLSRLVGQFLRYGAVGLISNLALYLVFILFHALGMTPTMAMTSCFALGCVATYFAHGRYSFQYGKLTFAVFAKYLMVYGSAYALNLGMLWFGTKRLGADPRLVQAVLVFVTGGYLFVLSRIVVFRPPPAAAPVDGDAASRGGV